MTAPGSQRYQDLDLRIDPILIGHACAYAKQYEGDWDVMVAARELVRATGSLPLAVARTVLNCARSDPRYAANLPAPRSGTFVGPFPSTEDHEDDDENGDEVPELALVRSRGFQRPQRHLRVAEPPTRMPRDLPATWPKRYGHTRDPDPDKNVWHVLDADLCKVRYWPEAEPDQQFSIWLRWVCGGQPKVANTVLLHDPPIGQLRGCRTCRARLENEELLDTPHFGPLQAWWVAEIDRLQLDLR